MKFFQKRGVAAVILVLAIAGSIAIGQARKPSDAGQTASTSIVGSYTYVNDTEKVLSAGTCEHIDAINASLFSQTGAQIAVEVISSTGDTDIASYTQQEFERLGVGSSERNNGVLILLALDNYYNGQPGGDYYVGWGSGFSSGEGNTINDLLNSNLESSFVSKDYDGGVRNAFDAIASYLANGYGVTIKENYVPATRDNYHALNGGYQTQTSGYVAEGAAALVADMSIPVGKDGKRGDFNLFFCKGCGICSVACPFGAIEMVKEEK